MEEMYFIFNQEFYITRMHMEICPAKFNEGLDQHSNDFFTHQITPKCISNFSMVKYHAQKGMKTAKKVDQKPLAMTIPAIHIGKVMKPSKARSGIFNSKMLHDKILR